MSRFKAGDVAIYTGGAVKIEVTIHSAMSNKRGHRYLVSADGAQHPSFGRRVVQDGELERIVKPAAPPPRPARWKPS